MERNRDSKGQETEALCRLHVVSYNSNNTSLQVLHRDLKPGKASISLFDHLLKLCRAESGK
jgi:hypothetical protein